MDFSPKGTTHRRIRCIVFWHSFLGINGKGEALEGTSPVAIHRCKEDAARLRKERDEKEVHARTGCMLRAEFLAGEDGVALAHA
jgi:gluconokinase